MKRVSIIGFGRFGKTLYKLLRDDFEILIYDRGDLNTDSINLSSNTTISSSLTDVYNSELIFFCIPISAFESVIKKHKKYFNINNILIDVLSVKTYPKNIFLKYLKKTEYQALLTHPMFGPNSSKNGFVGLPIVLDKFRTNTKNYEFLKKYFLSKKLNVYEISTDEHDRLAAQSQGLTHFIGRLLQDLKFKKTPFDSLGTKKLHEVTEQTVNDTWQLFSDLQTYNPYTKRMRYQLGKSYHKLFNQLIPAKVNDKYTIFGVQGGKGSFNEQAVLEYIEKIKIQKYKIKYLFTSEKVLANLNLGNIDYGLIAIANSTGGIVEESIQSLAKYRSQVTADFQILIQHYLIKKQGVELSKVDTIIAHPQVFAQCKNTLEKYYSKYKLFSGEGDLLDTAKAAEYLSLGRLTDNFAVLGSKKIAEIYNLEIVAENLQDKTDNLTRFLLLKRV